MRARRIAVSVLLFLLGLLAGLTLVELATRIWWRIPETEAQAFAKEMFRPDSFLGWELISNAAGWHVDERNGYRIWVENNSHGLRDREHPYERTPAVARIFLVGDSTTWGWGVEHPFADLLEERFSGRLEVVNGGVPGFSPDQYYLRYLRDGRWYESDLVLVALSISDDLVQPMMLATSRTYKPTFVLKGSELVPLNIPIADPTIHVSGDLFSPPFANLDTERGVSVAESSAPSGGGQSTLRQILEPLVSFLRDNSRIYALLARLKDASPQFRTALAALGLVAPDAGDVTDYYRLVITREFKTTAGWKYLSRWDRPEYAEALRLLEGILARFRDDTGGRMMVVLIPEKEQVDMGWQKLYREAASAHGYDSGDLDFDRPNRLLADMLRRNGIPVIDLLPDFQAAAHETELFFRQETHPNAAGHRLIAEGIYRFLVTNYPTFAGKEAHSASR